MSDDVKRFARAQLEVDEREELYRLGSVERLLKVARAMGAPDDARLSNSVSGAGANVRHLMSAEWPVMYGTQSNG